MKVSHVSVLNWVKKYGNQVDLICTDKPLKITELDELHTYVGRKNYRWIWICVSRNDRAYVDFTIGNRGTKTGLKLWGKVGKYAAGMLAADCWKSYNEIVPEEKLVQANAKTYTVESYNGLIRHFLARFRRKSKCYSRSEKMIEITLKLFFAHRNNTPAIFNY